MSARQKAPPPPLAAFGLLVRARRVTKGLTQERAARGADVSRKQWALLEKGQNVSAVFMKKVAKFLDLREIPLGDGLFAAGPVEDSVDVTALIRLADDFQALANSFIDEVRNIAFEAALRRPGRGENSEAIAEFIANTDTRRASDELHRTINDLASDVAEKNASFAPSARRSAKARKREA